MIGFDKIQKIYKIPSINLHGFGFKFDLLKQFILQNDIDILLIQESWRYNLNDISINGYNIIHNSSMDPNCKTVGRPFGGVGILIKSSIPYSQKSPLSKPKDLDYDLYGRLISVYLEDSKTLLSNIYMPCYDSRFSTDQNLVKLESTLTYLDSITDNYTNQILIQTFHIQIFNYF